MKRRFLGAMLRQPRFAFWLLPIGCVLWNWGLMALGWRRHGAAADDLSFLHLDHIFDPSWQAWVPHMRNLLTALAGLLCMVVAAVMLVGRLVQWIAMRIALRRDP